MDENGIDQVDDDIEREIQAAVACLQLPHMSIGTSIKHPTNVQTSPTTTDTCNTTTKCNEHHIVNHNSHPTITILVCADIDLKSTSALAEYTIEQRKLFTKQQQQQQQQRKSRDYNQQNHNNFEDATIGSSCQSPPEVDDTNEQHGFDVSLIDLIIAAGPCSREEEICSYLRGSRRRSNKNVDYSRTGTSTNQNTVGNNNNNNDTIDPFLRSRETSSALEGLMTAAISQLESIVCRVVYCPGYTDPITTLLRNYGGKVSFKRLTPNSRNIHQQWLPLAPGLGCAALFYLDNTDKLIDSFLELEGKQQLGQGGFLQNQFTSARYSDSITGNYFSIDGDDDDDDDDEDSSRKSVSGILSEQIVKLKQSSDGYCSNLNRLLQLAPTPVHPLFELTQDAYADQPPKAQSILVTKYIDGVKLVAQTSNGSVDESDPERRTCTDQFHLPQHTTQNCQKSDHEWSSSNNDSSLDFEEDILESCNSKDDYKANSVKANQFGEIESPLLVCGNHRQTSSRFSKKNQPWSADHLEFMQSADVQSLLCLEIASGYSADNEPNWIDVHGNIIGPRGVVSPQEMRRHPMKNCRGPILVPGSLRERGEFCIIELVLIDQKSTKVVSQSVSPPITDRRFSWKVQTVNFHRMN